MRIVAELVEFMVRADRRGIDSNGVRSVIVCCSDVRFASEAQEEVVNAAVKC